MVLHRFIKAALFLSTLHIGSVFCQSAPRRSDDSEFLIRNFSTQDGLPQNSVRGIVQTGDGYLWMATQEGLVRFDGRRFVVFDKFNTPILEQSLGWALHHDRSDAIWFGTYGGGVTRIRPNDTTHWNSRSGLSNDFINSILEDSKGRLWIGTRSGLNCLVNGQWSRIAGLAADEVIAVCEDRSGEIWIGTGAGLNRWSESKIEFFLPGAVVTAVAMDSDGRIVAGTRGAGLFLNEAGSFQEVIKAAPSDEVITTLYTDRKNRTWVGTPKGLRILRNRTLTEMADIVDEVLTVFEDYEGNLWVGTEGRGVFRLSSRKIRTLSMADGLSSDVVTGILEDRRGRIWVATRGGGLNRVSESGVRKLARSTGLGTDVVWSMYEDSLGRIWCGTDAGVYAFDGERFVPIGGLGNVIVNAITEDQQGRIWLGTEGNGLYRIDRDGARRIFTTHDGLVGNFVYGIHQHRDGSLWILTDGGLGRYQNNQWKSYTESNGLPTNFVYGVYEDSSGVLWFGTSGGGLMRFDGNKFVSYRKTMGLFDDVVFSILEDHSGMFWMSCNRGIFRVDKAELEAYAEGSIGRISSVSYTEADGMLSRECNGGSQPSAFKMRTGELWFPTIRGVARVDVERMHAGQPPLTALFEEVTDDRGSSVRRVGMVLEAGNKKLEIRYTAPMFSTPEKIHFRYKLEGYDDDWVEAGTRRTAYYTSIPPGDYRFHVSARNADGVWSSESSVLLIRQSPYFFQTWWFFLSSAVAVGLVVAGGIRWRLRRLLDQRNLLEQKVKERTVELEKAMNELQTRISQIKQLSGLLPICSSCKKIRDDQGYWHQLETYLTKHTELDFSHGICRDCAERLYPELFKDADNDSFPG